MIKVSFRFRSTFEFFFNTHYAMLTPFYRKLHDLNVENIRFKPGQEDPL
jgi:hypothetical protein